MPPKRGTKSKQDAPKKGTKAKRSKPDSSDAGAAGPSEEKPAKRAKKADHSQAPNITEPPKNSWLFGLLNDDNWKSKLCGIFHGEQFNALEKSVNGAYNNKQVQVFPPKELIFNAFNITPFDEVKVVILGQDPYHDDNQAHGLSFSVPMDVNVPRSLKNIYKELTEDIPGFKAPDHGCLEKWAQNGVLLLNATLTVEAHKPNSHSKMGWQKFTDQVIQVLSASGPPMAFILWGGFAHKKAPLIDASRHGVIKTAHPSPLSVNKFLGCRCFSQANDWLVAQGRSPVDWSL